MSSFTSRLRARRTSAGSEVMTQALNPEAEEELESGQGPGSGTASTGHRTATHGILRLRTQDGEAAEVHHTPGAAEAAAGITMATRHVEVPGVPGGVEVQLGLHPGMDVETLPLSPDTLRAIAAAAAAEDAEDGPAAGGLTNTAAAGLPTAGAAALPVPVPGPVTADEVAQHATGLDARTIAQARQGLLLDVVVPVTPHPVPIPAARLAEMLLLHRVKAAHFDLGAGAAIQPGQDSTRAARAAAAEARARGETMASTASYASSTTAEASSQPPQSRPRRRSWWRRLLKGRDSAEDEEAQGLTQAAGQATAEAGAATAGFGHVLDPSTVPVAVIVRPGPVDGEPYEMPAGAGTATDAAAAAAVAGQEPWLLDTRPPPRHFRRIRMWWREHRQGVGRVAIMVLFTGLMVAAVAAAPFGGLFIAANVFLLMAGLSAAAVAARNAWQARQERQTQEAAEAAGFGPTAGLHIGPRGEILDPGDRGGVQMAVTPNPAQAQIQREMAAQAAEQRLAAQMALQAALDEADAMAAAEDELDGMARHDAYGQMPPDLRRRRPEG